MTQQPCARLCAARRIVAETLLGSAAGRDDFSAPAAVPVWRAWLFAGWVSAMLVGFCVYLLGLVP